MARAKNTVLVYVTYVQNTVTKTSRMVDVCETEEIARARCIAYNNYYKASDTPNIAYFDDQKVCRDQGVYRSIPVVR